jgi:hypothetical protein
MYFLEIRCSKQGSPELSKCYTSKGPSTVFCQDEEGQKEPLAWNNGGKCPWPGRSSQLWTALTPLARPPRDYVIRDNCFHTFSRRARAWGIVSPLYLSIIYLCSLCLCLCPSHLFSSPRTPCPCQCEPGTHHHSLAKT